MPVIFTKGDLLQTPGLHAFAHTCDLTGAMSAGISLAFKKRWPAMHADFLAQAAARPLQMGDTVRWADGTDTVFSLIVQSGPDKVGKTSALDRAVRSLVESAIEAKVEQIAVSRLGAGPAKLDWTRVKLLLTERSNGVPVTLHAFEQFVRAKP